MMRLKNSIMGLVIVAAMVSVGCAGLRHPATAGLSLEGQAAVAGRQLVAAISSAADGTDVMIDTAILTKDQGVAVLQTLRAIGSESERLAEALDVIRLNKVGTTGRENAVLKAGNIVKSLQAAVIRGVIPGGTEASRARLAALLGPISAALVDIGMLIQQGQEPDLPDSWIPAFTERMNLSIFELELEGVR